jgi:branched-chain amino acid transport system permease protein
MTLLAVALISGLVTGCIYALAALGLVIVYRATRVLNFAHGAIGMFSTYFFGRTLYDSSAPRMPIFLALILTLTFAAVLGLAIERLVVRPLRNAPILTRVIATLALLTVLQFMAGYIWGDTTYVFRGIFPDGTVDIGVEFLPYSQILTVVVTVGLVVLITLFLRRTRMGTALRAVSNNPDAAGLMGISIVRINQIAWAMGSVLACIAGLLLTPDFGLNTFQLTLTVIVYSVGAAVLGGFVSLPLALAGGILVGETIAIVRTYFQSDISGIDYLVAFGIIIVALMLRRDLSLTDSGAGQGAALTQAPSAPSAAGAGDEVERLAHRMRNGVATAGVLGVVALPFMLRHYDKPSYMTASVLALIVALAALSLVLLMGYVGQISLAQFAFLGIGALVVSRLAPYIGYWPALLCGGLLAVPAGLVAALPALRLRGIYLAVATLGFGQVVTAAVLLNPTLVGGADLHLDTPSLGPIHFTSDLDGAFNLYFVVLAVLTVFVVFTIALRLRKTGMAFNAVRDGEVAAASIGISVSRYKLLAFAFSAFYAGIAGGLYMLLNPVVDGGSLDPLRGSIPLLIVLVISGVSSAGGAVMAGFLFAVGPLLLPQLLDSGFSAVHAPFSSNPDLILALFGVGLLVSLATNPKGVAGGLEDTTRRVAARLVRPRASATAVASSVP